MAMARVTIIFSLLLLLSACARHTHCCCSTPAFVTIQDVEGKYGTPNEIISKPRYAWYGYVTKLQTDYPAKLNFSSLYFPIAPIAKPVPLAHNSPYDSFARYGCSVWFKTNKNGVIIEARRLGKHCEEKDFRTPVGH
jgi:hypothetical protein